MSNSNSMNTELDDNVEINEEMASGEEATTTQTDVQPDTDDLDAFNDLLTGKVKRVEKEPSTTEDAQEDTTEEVEDLAPKEPKDEPAPKPKSRFQERIDELSAKAREARQEKEELERKLNEALAKLEEKTPDAARKDTAAAVPAKAGPQPDAVLEDGTPKYPLGEFDPAYVRDLTRFELQQALDEKAAKEAEQAKAQELQQAQQQLQQEWQGKVEKSLEKYPDLLDKEEVLATAFENVDENYGMYLASVIMSMDYGPDVLYHLSTNLEEAKQIVNSGPARATIALGRLEARYALQEEEKKQHKLKVSKAPIPPDRLNKGSMVSKEIPDDTDDLDAFAAKLFSSSRRR